MTAGHIYTIAGDRHGRVLRRRRPGHQRPSSAPDRRGGGRRGNLVIADTGNNRIRVVAASTGTFYGQAMTAGRHLHRRRRRHVTASPATAARPPAPSWTTRSAVDGGRRGQPGDRRHRQHRGSGWWPPAPARSTAQAMTAGDIYTVAGTGTRGFSGDGGPRPPPGLASGHGRGPLREPPDRRLRHEPDPARAQPLGLVLPPGGESRAHLHDGRQRHRGDSGAMATWLRRPGCSPPSAWPSTRPAAC